MTLNINLQQLFQGITAKYVLSLMPVRKVLPVVGQKQHGEVRVFVVTQVTTKRLAQDAGNAKEL